MNQLRIEEFFQIAREREAIRLKREQGLPPPWTSDPVLSTFRFCNVHREDDRVSQWIIDHYLDDSLVDTTLIQMALVARWFNHPTSLQALRDIVRKSPVELNGAEEALAALPPGPRFGSAYIVQSPTGLSKVDGILRCLRVAGAQLPLFSMSIRDHNSLEVLHSHLTDLPHMGPFMAYQVVCDLAYTRLLKHATDTMTWSCVGPGSTKGLGWIYGDDPETFNYNSSRDRDYMKAIMRDLLAMVVEPYWPEEYKPWKMCTVQHWLCEYSKWKKGMAGERLKRTYK